MTPSQLRQTVSTAALLAAALAMTPAQGQVQVQNGSALDAGQRKIGRRQSNFPLTQVASLPNCFGSQQGRVLTTARGANTGASVADLIGVL